jgi:hypothetical protein
MYRTATKGEERAMKLCLMAVVMALVGALMSPMSPARADEIRSEVEKRQATARTAV